MKPATDFVFVRMPEIHFGAGKFAELASLLRPAQCVLLMTGSASFLRSRHYDKVTLSLANAGIRHFQVSVAGEPSPDFVDQTVARYRGEGIDRVIGIGGGSAMDAGKAVSAMLPQQGSVTDFLEGRETRKHDGRKIPYIAIPTSSGTGAEATKNAVLSQIGGDGFKSSLRHDNFVPDIALIDPQLMLSCPPDVTAACSLDALTQLLESYVSTKASPMTDALALSGLEHAAAGLLSACENGETDLVARGHMAYAALLSGVTLANAGLGVVHGLAGPIGGFFTIPHGVVCGTLLAEATRLTIAALLHNEAENHVALAKYATVGALLAGRPPASLRNDCATLVQTLEQWSEGLHIPRLGHYGITAADFPKILAKSNSKNSPAALDREQMASILEARL